MASWKLRLKYFHLGDERQTLQTSAEKQWSFNLKAKSNYFFLWIYILVASLDSLWGWQAESSSALQENHWEVGKEDAVVFLFHMSI